MRSRLVWALVALNALLLATLVGQWLRPTTAHAQAPRASDYLMIPAHIQASPTDLVYVIDEANGLLTARLFDGQVIQDMGQPIDLNRYFNPPGGRRGRGQ